MQKVKNLPFYIWLVHFNKIYFPITSDNEDPENPSSFL